MNIIKIIHKQNMSIFLTVYFWKFLFFIALNPNAKATTKLTIDKIQIYDVIFKSPKIIPIATLYPNSETKYIINHLIKFSFSLDFLKIIKAKNQVLVMINRRLIIM